MTDLIAATPRAAAWSDEAIARLADPTIFSRIERAVIWTDATDAEGQLLLPIDPYDLAASVNAEPYPLQIEHDPGRPAGRMLAAQVFKDSDSRTFVAAVLGFYDGAKILPFAAFGLDPSDAGASPAWLPDLGPDFWVALAADTRHVERDWLDGIIRSAPVRVELEERSLNAADPTHEVITVGVLFMTLVWNPLVTTFAQEASKTAYAATRTWLRSLLGRMAERRDPVVEIQAQHHDCVISFMLRGRNVARHYKAYDLLPAAATRAEGLIVKMIASGLKPTRLVYEFHHSDDTWFPKFAELNDGRLVSDDMSLIAAEQLPSGLSLGLSPKSLE